VTSLLILGAGGHARAVIDVVEQSGAYEIAGLVGVASEVGSQVLGYPVLGSDAELPTLFREHACVAIAVGQIKTPEPRIRLFELAERHGATLPVIVSPHAYVSRHATLGKGTVVMHGAVVNAGATVGRNCIINSQALVEHDVVIEDHCHVATGAILNSGVRIGAGTFVGSQSSVRQSTAVGARCVIGMGARVIADCEAGSQVLSPMVK
jgi:sugar O-acyltransferase (sialic acid O-acetyltransferase NeuD family)